MNTTGDGSSRITLRELLGNYDNFGIGGSTKSIGVIIKENVMNNWPASAGTLVAAKAIPKIVRSVGITSQANKLSKSIGLGSIVQL